VSELPFEADSLEATVVIVNFNGKDYLRECLTALRSDPSFDYPIVVVDNESSDGSAQLVESDFPGVKLLNSGRNLGFAGGNNLALNLVKTPIAVLLNPDAAPEPGAIRKLVSFLRQPENENVSSVCAKVLFAPKFFKLSVSAPEFVPGGGDNRTLGFQLHSAYVSDDLVFDKMFSRDLFYPKEGIGNSVFRWTKPEGEVLVPIAPRIAKEDQPILLRLLCSGNAGTPIELNGERFIIGDKAEWLPPITIHRANLVDVINSVGGYLDQDGFGGDNRFWDVDDGSDGGPEEVFSAGGTAVAVRMRCGNEVHWFDEDFFLYYEDTDLAWRLRLQGWTAYVLPDAIVRHHHSVLTIEGSDTWLFHVERNRLLMLAKNAPFAMVSRAFIHYLVDYFTFVARSIRRRCAFQSASEFRVNIRTKVLLSFLGLLPKMLVMRFIQGRRNVLRREVVSNDWARTN
jgi:GT2 family glycosyltransferase